MVFNLKFNKKKNYYNQPQLTVIVCFHNMRREAARTLYTLKSNYQQGVYDNDYRVIAVDNGSVQALDEKLVKNFGDNFYYEYWKTKSVSPVDVINYQVRKSSTEYIMCLIDGARMLSPGILRLTLQSFKAFDDPFVFTTGMHIGKELQNITINDGYDQNKEDKILEAIDWKNNGYSLFSISVLAASAQKGFFSLPNESNCFAMKRKSFLKIGGFERKFQSKGGGLANLDFFKRVVTQENFSKIMLLGEATFHQFHGGVATNALNNKRPWSEFKKEYKAIRGKEYFRPDANEYSPILFGKIQKEMKDLISI